MADVNIALPATTGKRPECEAKLTVVFFVRGGNGSDRPGPAIARFARTDVIRLQEEMNLVAALERAAALVEPEVVSRDDRVVFAVGGHLTGGGTLADHGVDLDCQDWAVLPDELAGRLQPDNGVEAYLRKTTKGTICWTGVPAYGEETWEVETAALSGQGLRRLVEGLDTPSHPETTRGFCRSFPGLP